MKKRLLPLVACCSLIVAIVVIASSSSEGWPGRNHLVAREAQAQYAKLSRPVDGWRLGPQSPNSFLMFEEGSDCFLSLNRESTDLNPADAVREHEQELESSGLRLESRSVRHLVLRSEGGPEVPYDLHIYKVGGPSTYASQAYGFAGLNASVTKVIANCSTPTGMQSALAALLQVRLRN